MQKSLSTCQLGIRVSPTPCDRSDHSATKWRQAGWQVGKLCFSDSFRFAKQILISRRLASKGVMKFGLNSVICFEWKSVKSLKNFSFFSLWALNFGSEFCKTSILCIEKCVPNNCRPISKSSVWLIQYRSPAEAIFGERDKQETRRTERYKCDCKSWVRFFIALIASPWN